MINLLKNYIASKKNNIRELEKLLSECIDSEKVSEYSKIIANGKRDLQKLKEDLLEIAKSIDERV